jgi:hypothetical protein
VTCDKTTPAPNPPIGYFQNGFFTPTPDFSYMNHKTLDYRLAAGSPGINFGDASNQPDTSLGTLDAKGFIQKNGIMRDANHHSAGAYEYGTGVGIEVPEHHLITRRSQFVISTFTDHISVATAAPIQNALTMNLYSGNGKLQKRTQGSFMDTKTLPSGLYLLEVLCGSDRAMEKVMK